LIGSQSTAHHLQSLRALRFDICLRRVPARELSGNSIRVRKKGAKQKNKRDQRFHAILDVLLTFVLEISMVAYGFACGMPTGAHILRYLRRIIEEKPSTFGNARSFPDRTFQKVNTFS
jgi:hypothetical protein